MKRRLLSILALFTFFNGFGQLTSNYPAGNFTVSQGTYTDLGTTGTAITTSNNDDALSGPEPIGFTFTYNGVAFTDFILSTNGYIKLGTTPPSSASLFYAAANSQTGGVFNSTNAADANIIVPFGFDLIGAAGAEYRVHTSGAVGSRVCTIQFKNLTEDVGSLPTQYSNINFQVRLYETSNVIEFVYGTWIGSANPSNAKWAIVGLRGTSNAATEIVSVTKGSVTAWSAATAANGNYATTNSLNFGNPPTRPAPVAGVTYTFVPVQANDLAVTAVYTFGKLPKPYVTPHYVRAKIRNNGSATQTNFNVALNVTGTNPFSDNVTVSTLAPGFDSFVVFQGYTPTLNGSQLVTVSVNPDDNNLNNSKDYGQLVNDDVYSYADPLLPTAGGVGFTGSTGQFCAKFPYSGVANTVNQLGVNFSGGGVPLRVGIWGKNATTGGPGALLWQSATFTSVAGLNTIPVNPPVSITDTFFAGVLQTGTTNASFGYQNEAPIRDKTFYYGALNSTTWSDFATAASNFRFMVEPRFQSPNDMGMTSVDYPCKIVPVGQAGFFPMATAFNYGLIPQSSVSVTLEIYDNLGVSVYNSNATIPNINSNASEQVTFSTLFTPTTAGNYTIKTWSDLLGDASNINDTASSTLQVVDYSAITNGGTRLQFDGVNDHIEVQHNPNLNPTIGLTLETWVSAGATGTVRTLISKDSTATFRSYNLSIDAAGFPELTIATPNGTVTATSSVPLTTGVWTHVAGTYDGTGVNIYVNGEVTGSAFQLGSVEAYNAPLAIGRTAPGSAFFNGGLDEIKVWAVARTPVQIRQNMHRIYPNFSEPDMVLNLHLDEGVGSNQTADASGNCNNGTLVSMDVQNNPLATWFVSTLPLGAPTVVEQAVSTSGPVTFTGANLTLDFAGFSGSDAYVVHYFNTAPQGTQPAGVGVNPGTWIVYRYGNGSFTSANATYQLAPGILPALASDVSLYSRYNGSGAAWTLFQNGATSINNVNSTADFTYTSNAQFNQQFGIGLNAFPLSVKLISFGGEASNKDAVLTWETAHEKDMAKYILQRSTDGSSFEDITTVKAKGGQNGFNSYGYTDRNAADKGATVYYRLMMVDNNGDNNISPVATVSFSGKATDIFKVQPNPFQNNLSISYTAKDAHSINIAIVDLKGSVVYQQAVMVRKGLNLLTIQPESSLANGVYMLQVGDKQHMKTEKIMKN